MRKTLLLIGLIVVVIVARYAIGRYEYTNAGSVTEIFVIRGSDSLFMDSRVKLLLAIATVALIAYDWRISKRPDYFWAGLTGLVIAAALEALAILSGERQFRSNDLFGIQLPFVIDLFVRAVAEFAFYVVTSSLKVPFSICHTIPFRLGWV
jgi:hypothetical protein